ncbi:SseB family protein [Streptococcus sp. sy004]|uniref:SseB family protein n=1 Tax=Streptococcus sp. sy004 TaxID=2600149 RepID=UPI0011B7ADA5|nr:SseB family protein [Streptococcus sp. sy004]TWT09779.1 SseB family protein [Streptococcus sp. sy004]
MTKLSNFNTEFDDRLRAFIKEPDNFLEGIALVHALNHYPVIASEKPYALKVDGEKVIPVFTDRFDLETFKKEQKSAREQNWIERSSLDVLEESIVKGLSGLVYNLKKTGDFSNSTVFKNNDMVQFINNFTTVLNAIMNEKNIAADTLERSYIVPAFILPNDDGSFDRMFPTLSDQNKNSYVPVFSNLQSFAKWYNHQDFGQPFREAQGVILAWTIDDIYQPNHGQNDIDDTMGIVVNPLDTEQILINWSELEE